eukprot:516015-Alexandrium_andersonii.AAC.1
MAVGRQAAVASEASEAGSADVPPPPPPPPVPPTEGGERPGVWGISSDAPLRADLLGEPVYSAALARDVADWVG